MLGPTDTPPKAPAAAVTEAPDVSLAIAGGGGDGDPDVSFHPNPHAAAADTKANGSPTVAKIMTTLMQLTTIVTF